MPSCRVGPCNGRKLIPCLAVVISRLPKKRINLLASLATDFEFHTVLLPLPPVSVRPEKVQSPWQCTASHRCLFKPSAPAAHVNLCAMVEVEVNLLHELLDKEYAPAVIGQE